MIKTEILENCLNLILPKKSKHTCSESKRLATCMDKFLATLGDGFQHTLPVSFILKLTSSCNLRCKHCFYSGEKEYYNQENELSKNEWISFINYLSDEINPLGIALTGGEVFLRKDVFEIIECIKNKNIPLTIQTNATLITEEYAEDLSKLLFCKTDKLSVSLDGADEESHDFIRGAGSFKKTISAIKALRKYEIPISVNLTLTTVSAPNMTKIFNLCSQLGVKQISINKFKVCNNEHSYLKLDEEKSLEYTSQIIEESKRFPEINANIKSVNIYDYLGTEEGRDLLDKYLTSNKIERNRCYTCHNHNRATISSVGNVFLCSMDETQNAIIGNIRKQNFLDIWNNRFASPYFQPRTLETIKCNDCKYIGLCSGGCMVSSYMKYGDINMPPNECTYFDIKKGLNDK